MSDDNTHVTRRRLLAGSAIGMASLAGCATGSDLPNANAQPNNNSSSNDGEPTVTFANLDNGAKVKSPFTVKMGADGLSIEPSGEVNDGAGHFHIMVDAGPVPKGETVPSDGRHLHFGDGSKTAELALPTGTHRLTLQAANGAHKAYDAYKTIEVEVTENTAPVAYFETPSYGAHCDAGVAVQMATENLEVGNGNHFHIVVDESPVPAGEQIPDDDNHLHFDGSQTVLDLSAGMHTLHLQVGDENHVAKDVLDSVPVEVSTETAIEFAKPTDGATVHGEVPFDIDVTHYDIVASGSFRQNAGHLHFIVDEGPVPVGEPIPSDENHIHIGNGDVAGTLDLPAGEHTLTAQIGTGTHLATPVTAEVTITVEDGGHH